MAITETIECRKCGKNKERAEFYGGERRCRECRNASLSEWRRSNKDKVAAASQRYKAKNRDSIRVRNCAWLEKNPEWHAAAKLKAKVRKFGLTVEQYLAMIEGQGSKCGNLACGRPISKQDKGTHVDHCHESSRVRGILCGQCNRGQGYVSSPALLRAAADYLERHAAKLN